MASRKSNAAVLTFPSAQALQLSLTSELVPSVVQVAPARYRLLDDGTVQVAPSKALTRKQLAPLTKVGVVVDDKAKTAALVEASCWAEVLRPYSTPESELQTATVLFVLPQADAALGLAGELLRLGCDRQELCFFKEGRNQRALIKAVKPPYYTLARSLERLEQIQAFVPTPPGQEQVWTEVCHAHPLAAQLQPCPGELLLVGGDGRWQRLPAGPWTELYGLLDLVLPADEAQAHEPTAPERRLRVPLKLRPLARETPPSLWILSAEGAVALIDALVQQLPEREIDRLLYAAAGDRERPLIVLKARSGRGDPPLLDLPAAAHAPWLELGHLFLPADAILEPPLRRETLRELLAPSPEEVTWLAPIDDPDAPPGAARDFRIERIPESAFSPLTEWIEYVVHSAAEELTPWVRAASFDFEAFESTGLEWADARPERAPEREEPKKKRARRRAPELEEETPAPARPARTGPAQEAEAIYLAEAEETAPASEAEAALAALEQRFLELEAPADAPERTELWLDLARRYTALSRRRDASLSWTRALWEESDDGATALAARWAAAEARLLGQVTRGRPRPAEEVLTGLLGQARPEPEQVRGLAAALVQRAGEGAQLSGERLQQIQIWLNTHDAALDCRASWLAHLALSTLVGGDPLQLAQTRDRILARLSRGLSIELDVPTFLRFCGGGAGGGEAPNVEQLAGQLEALLTRFGKARRKRSAVEAPEAVTGAYVQLSFAYGFARLGRTERARELLGGGAGALDSTDAIHAYLLQAYTARVEHALAGLPTETPLPAEVGGLLNAMERFTRYKVDRLRQASLILEPQEHLDPVLAFQQAKADPRGEEFAPMRAMTDPEQLGVAVGQVMDKALAAGTSPEERDRLFDGVMDFFPLLPEAAAVPHLQTLVASVEVVAPPRRCLLLEEALMLGGFFMREELVRELVARLKDLIAELGAEHAAEVAKTLGQCLRSLRRVGLLEEAAELLSAVATSVGGAGSAALVARLHLAAGLADVGRMDRAEPIFVEGKQALAGTSLLLVDRLEITRALATALGHAPQAVATAEIASLAKQLPQISDSFNTNSHFCLSVIQFMESLVLGLASEQLVLGQLGRRWLDEDEYLVRRRIHRDLAQA